MPGTPLPTLNPAVRANLELVIDEVRWAAAQRMAWVRLAIAILAGAIFFVRPADAQTAPSRMGCAVFIVGAAGVLVVIHLFPKARLWASFSVAFVDVPIASAFQYLQSLALPSPELILPTNVAVMAVLVSLSTLSLSRLVIVATALMTLPSLLLLHRMAGLPWQPVLLVGAMPVGIAAVGFGVVSRIRVLVQTARKKDLLGKYVLGDRLGVGGMAEVLWMPASTLFALGVTLYEAVTSQRLFQRADPADLMRLALSQPIPPLRSVRPDVPHELETAIAQLLERKRDERTASARALLETLRGFQPELRNRELGRAQLMDWVARSKNGSTGDTTAPEPQPPDRLDPNETTATAALRRRSARRASGVRTRRQDPRP